MRRVVVVTMMLVFAVPASAHTVTAGNLVAGTIEQGVVVAGDQNLAAGPVPNLPFGTNAALAGSSVPPNPFAACVSVPFAENFAVDGVGPAEDDVAASSNFLGTNFVQAGMGDLSASVESRFFD